MLLIRETFLSNAITRRGRDKVLEPTRKAFDCLSTQVTQVTEVLTGPGDMGEIVCKGKNVRVVGRNSFGY